MAKITCSPYKPQKPEPLTGPAHLVCEDSEGNPKCKWYGRQTRRKFNSDLVHTIRFCRCPALMKDGLAMMLTDVDVIECTFFDGTLGAG